MIAQSIRAILRAHKRLKQKTFPVMPFVLLSFYNSAMF